MSDNTGVWLRARGVIDRRFAVFVIGLVLIAAIGGFLTYEAYGSNETEAYTEQVAAWESTGEFYHEATVVNGSEAFPEGEVLEGRSVYFLSTTPVLDGEFRYSYTATNDGQIDAESDLELVVRSVSAEDGNESDYWRYSRELGEASATLRPDESLQATFSQDLRNVREEIERVESDIGQGPGTTEVLVVATVDLGGTRNGKQVDRRRTYRLPLSIEQDYYRVEDPGPETHGGEQFAERVRTVSPGPLREIGGPVLLVVGLLGLGGLAIGRYRGSLELTDREQEYLSFRRDRSEFDEWISEAYVPSHRLSEAETHVKTTSLAGLVDIAIDIDRRVLETPDREQFVVMDGDVVYSYEPPSALPEGEERL